MKRFWLVLLSLGLIAAFSTSALAVDLKFSGEYYAAGMYLDRVGVNETGYAYQYYARNTATNSFTTGSSIPPWVLTTGYKGGNADTSTAFYFQRLRLTTTFIVHPGLYFITRADIMERAWGAPRYATTTATYATAPMQQSLVNGLVNAPEDVMSAGTRAENENIAFDLAYIQYVSPIGIFRAGYQIDGAWGTVFGDTSTPVGKIGYILPLPWVKGLVFGIQSGKNANGERSYGTWNGAVLDGAVDRDSSFYTAFVKYTFKGGETGFLAKYIRDATNRNAYAAYTALAGLAPFNPALATTVGLLDTGVKVQQVAMIPYAKVQLGPVALQGEVTYATGRISYDGVPWLIPASSVWAGATPGPQQNQKLDMWRGWLDATADFGVAYVGGTVAYMSGDKPETTDKREGGLTGGLDWNPCLIMFNQERTYWVGGIAGYDGTSNGSPMSNAYFAQLRAGVRPVDKLDIMGSFSWAKADKVPAGIWAGREYGMEVDLTATYKITNNLSYMLGAGYWFTGDYYKGLGLPTSYYSLPVFPEVKDDFMVIHKLTLTF